MPRHPPDASFHYVKPSGISSGKLRNTASLTCIAALPGFLPETFQSTSGACEGERARYGFQDSTPAQQLLRRRPGLRALLHVDAVPRVPGVGASGGPPRGLPLTNDIGASEPQRVVSHHAVLKSYVHFRFTNLSLSGVGGSQFIGDISKSTSTLNMSRLHLKRACESTDKQWLWDLRPSMR